HGPSGAQAGPRVRGLRFSADLRPDVGPEALGDSCEPGEGRPEPADGRGADAREGARPVRVTARVSRFRDGEPRGPPLDGVPNVAAGAGAVQRACRRAGGPGAP